MSNNFNNQLFLKTKFQSLKRQVSGKISENWKNDVFRWRHTSEKGQDMKYFFEKSLCNDDQLFKVKTMIKISRI